MSASARIPYPGPRPFETSEEDLFFGRERESSDLCSLVTAHRAVLLYAQSGAGKTSLLEARVIPALARDGVEVLPVARVHGAAALAERGTAGVPNVFTFNVLAAWAAEEAEPEGLATLRLADFLRRLPHVLDRHGQPAVRVAIIDQLEELFTCHPEHWKERRGLFEQLAEACEEDRLLRVVLAIREDFLADLDPFAELLPEALRASLRLEGLEREAAVRAVELPLRGTGRRFDDGVAGELVTRLLEVRSGGAPGAPAAEAQHVEPVQLQVVCRRLWQRLPAAVTVIGREHLETLGDVDEALRSFYDEAVASTARSAGAPEERLRQWFEAYLITPAGTRGVVFQGKSTTGELPNHVVRTLEDVHHIVRGEVRHGSRWFELTHDRFIAPIQQSNLPWLRRATARRWRWRAVAIGLAGMAASAAGTSALRLLAQRQAREESARQQALAEARLQQQRAEAQLARERLGREQERARAAEQDLQEKVEAERRERIHLEQADRAPAEDAIARLRAEKAAGAWNDRHAEAVLDGLANYLWAKRQVPRLAALLEANADLVPALYGRDQEMLALVPDAPADADCPVVEYNPLSQLRQEALAHHWRSLAMAAAARWGLPIPVRVRFREQPGLSTAELGLSATGRPELRVRIERAPGEVVVARPDGPPALVQFFHAHRTSRLGELRLGGEWWRVPAWSRPLWKAAGHQTFEREGALVLALMSRLIEEPERVLDRSSVAFLLQRLRESRPTTVGEAMAARGLDRLTSDLTALVARGHPLTDLEYLLDALSDDTGATPAQAAEAAMETVKAVVWSRPSAPPPAGGRGAAEELDLAARGRGRAYREVQRLLPAPRAPVRVYLGKRLARQLAPGGRPSPQVTDALTGLRREFFGRFGFLPPLPRLEPDDALPPDGYRIEAADQQSGEAGTRARVVRGPRVLPALVHDLRDRYTAFRSWWLTPEAVGDLVEGTPKPVRAWLRARYSVTELKLILRAVVAPDPAEVVASSLRAPPPSAQPERSLAELDWLLRSLAFWAAASPERDAGRIAGRLRALQQARLSSPGAGVAPPAIKGVAEGIAALRANDLDHAAALFRKALARDPAAATAAFTGLFALERAPSDTLAALRRACQVPAPGRFAAARAPSASTRYRLEELLAQHGDALTVEDRRQLRLCLLRHAVDTRQHAWARTLHAQLAKDSPWATWSPAEQYLLAQLALAEGDRHGPPLATQETISQLLRAALERSPPDVAAAAFAELLRRCESGYSPPGHAELLRRIPPLFPGSYRIQVGMGWYLASRDSRQDVEEALRLLGQAAELIPSLPARERAAARARVDLGRAIALRHALPLTGEGAERARLYDEAVGLVERVLEQHPRLGRDRPPLDTVHAALLDLHQAAGRGEAAARAAQRWRDHVPESTEAVRRQSLVYLARSQADGAVALLRAARERTPAGDRAARTELLLAAARIETLAGEGHYEEDARAFLDDTDHPDRDLVRLLLYWRLKLANRHETARQLLADRADELDRKTWDERLEQGDRRVWGEMLIALYAGTLSPQALAERVGTRERFEASPLRFTGSPYESLSVELQFYGALLQEISAGPRDGEARMVKGLRRVLELGRSGCPETEMARFLLQQHGAEASARPL